jgi:hypothetical protein
MTLKMKDLTTMNWNDLYASLNDKGYAHVPGILSRDECLHLQGFYDDRTLFRSVINMQRYRFGKGEYKYFSYPLPPIIQSLRELFYKPLVHIANEWMGNLNIGHVYPEDHATLIAECKTKNQVRPTPLILRYEAEGFNTLHQDLYGDVYFPFQVVLVLTQPGKDHEGGELVFVEQLPRAQSKAEVLAPQQGDAIIFTTNFRPVKGSRGYYRAKMKHGVSPLKSGVRYALGIIFHDGQ